MALGVHPDGIPCVEQKSASRLQFYWRLLTGGTFLFLLFYTAISASLTFIPTMVVLFLCRFSLTRWMVDALVGSWLMFAPALYELVYGVKIKVTGDLSKLNKNACSLILLNHRTRLDWLFILSLQARCASIRRFKISLKYPLRHIPGLGWAMQIAGFLFLKRTFEEDKTRIESLLDHFKAWLHAPQMLLFPEGTDFRPDSLESSKRYARKNELPPYDYVLHPRTTGFVSMLEYMKHNNALDQVVDVTVGYPKNMVHKEADILIKQLPKEILFHVKVFDVNMLPRNPTRLSEWLQERWREKEKLLKNLHEKKTWPVAETDLTPAQAFDIEKETTLYYVGALIYWIIFTYIIATAFLSFPLVRWYYLLSFVFCVILAHVVGIDNYFMVLDRHLGRHRYIRYHEV